MMAAQLEDQMESNQGRREDASRCLPVLRMSRILLFVSELSRSDRRGRAGMPSLTEDWLCHPQRLVVAAGLCHVAAAASDEAPC